MKASKTLTLQKSTQKRKSLRNPKDCTDFCSGDPAGIRTPDTLLKRQVLCRLSYWVIWDFDRDGCIRISAEKPRQLQHATGILLSAAFRIQNIKFGRDGWIRTSECRRQRPMPYRLATPLYPLNQKDRPYPKHNALREAARHRVIWGG